MAKAHGSSGRVVCSAADGLPFLLEPGQEVWVVPPSLHGPRHGVVQEVQPGERGALVALSCSQGRADAESLAGRFLLVPESQLPEGWQLEDPDWALGVQVRDVALGDLGRVAAVLRGPAQDVWQVEGPFGEVLVPVAEELLESVEGRCATFRLPQGLVEVRP